MAIEHDVRRRGGAALDQDACPAGVVGLVDPRKVGEHRRDGEHLGGGGGNEAAFRGDRDQLAAVVRRDDQAEARARPRLGELRFDARL